MPTRENVFLITCEHGGNRIPARFRHCFADREDVLQTHRAFDPGALALARDLAKQCGAPLISSTISRLLIELNRSTWHKALFSEFTRPLDKHVRDDIFRAYYQPYRDEVEAHIGQAVNRGKRVIHISSHSFAPELDGEVRNADVGLLYDPTRARERELCRTWQQAIREQGPQFAVRMNYPYSGTSDGFPAYLRKRFNGAAYLGIELEVNQHFYLNDKRQWRALSRMLILALQNAASSLV